MKSKVQQWETGTFSVYELNIEVHGILSKTGAQKEEAGSSWVSQCWGAGLLAVPCPVAVTAPGAAARVELRLSIVAERKAEEEAVLWPHSTSGTPLVPCSVPALAPPADVGRARGCSGCVTTQKCPVPFPSFLTSVLTLAWNKTPGLSHKSKHSLWLTRGSRARGTSFLLVTQVYHSHSEVRCNLRKRHLCQVIFLFILNKSSSIHSSRKYYENCQW